MPVKQLKKKQTAIKVSVNSILVNLALSAFKLFAGIAARSGAMISDAAHSASDVFSTVIVLAGVAMASKEADEKHQYGHERMECAAAILLGAVLCVTGIVIGAAGLQKILAGSYETLAVPGALAMGAALISIAVKEGMYWYTRTAAIKTDSGALMADAWHHRSDALSSVGSFMGILGARIGFPVLDPLASVVICIFIIKASYDIFADSIRKMIDESCSRETVEQMKQVILKQPGVEGIDDIRTRKFGARVYVDVEISMDGTLPLREAHETAEQVHLKIEENFAQVKHCMVHVNPVKNEDGGIEKEKTK